MTSANTNSKVYPPELLYIVCCFLFIVTIFSWGCGRSDNKKEGNGKQYDINEYRKFSFQVLPDSLIPILEEVRAEALYKQDFETFTELSNMLTNNYILNGDYENGFECANDFLEKVLEAKDSVAIPGAYYNLGRLYFGLGLHEVSLDYFLQVAGFSLPDVGLCRVFYAIAEVSRNSRLNESLDPEEYYRKSERLARQFNDSLLIYPALFGLSQMYFKSLDIYELDKMNISKGMRDSLAISIRFVEEGLKYKSDDYTLNVALGLNYIAQNRFEEGLRYVEKGCEAMLEVPDLVPQAKNVMASMYAYIGNYREAISFAEEAYSFADKYQKKEDMKISAKILYHIYKEFGDNGKALEAYEKHIRLQNDLSDMERQINLIYNQVKYDTQLKEERLTDSEARNRIYRFALIAIVILLIMVSGLLIFSYQTSIKKANAYRKLIDNADQWASEMQGNGTSPMEEDWKLIENVYQLMTQVKRYKDANLSLDSLADELSVNRHTLSKTINKTTGKNFNNFINDYRIKEALRLMSSAEYSDLHIDDIIERTGFNSRTTFYVAFKKTIGISPSEYKNNKKRATSVFASLMESR